MLLKYVLKWNLFRIKMSFNCKAVNQKNEFCNHGQDTWLATPQLKNKQYTFSFIWKGYIFGVKISDFWAKEPLFYLRGSFRAWTLLVFGGAASQYIGLPACLPVCLSVCLFQLASGEVSLTILRSTIVGEYRRVFYNYPGPTNEQCHTQTA